MLAKEGLGGAKDLGRSILGTAEVCKPGSCSPWQSGVSHSPFRSDSESPRLEEYTVQWGSFCLSLFSSILLPGSEELLGHVLMKSVKRNLSVPE